MTGRDSKLPFWVAFFLSVTVTYALCHDDLCVGQEKGKRDKNKWCARQDNDIEDMKNRWHKEYLVVWYNIPDSALSWGLPSTGVQWCPGVRCRVSSNSSLIDKANAVIVNAEKIPQSAKPRGSPNQFWVFYGMESPVHYHTETYGQSDWVGRFNWTMTYRLDSDIPAPYGKLQYFPDPDPMNFTAIALNKTRPVAWFVSNCFTFSKRSVYVKKLQKYIDVDIYGLCGKEADTTGLLNDTYKFYLSFENSLCVDYVTEKLFKTYSAHIIPIVRGGSNYKHIPKGTYINTADFTGPEQLAKYLHFLDKNITAYSEMLERKHSYRDVGTHILCNLCHKLQNNPKEKTYSDIHDWLWMSGKACHPAHYI